MHRYMTAIQRVMPFALACLWCVLGLSMTASRAVAWPIIWPADTSQLSYLEYYRLEEASCMQDAPDDAIPNIFESIDLKSTPNYRILSTNHVVTAKPGCNRFVVDFGVSSQTNIVFVPGATAKS